MSEVSKQFTRWLLTQAGRRTKTASQDAALDAAFRAGWGAAVRRERKAQRFSMRLIFGRVRRLQRELDARRLATSLGRSFRLHQAVEGDLDPANPFDVLDEARDG